MTDYYARSEVSNSDLTALKEALHPRMQYGDREKAFRFGSLVDAIITEEDRVNLSEFKVDDVQYTEDEFLHAMAMKEALYRHAHRHDAFLKHWVLDKRRCSTQRVMVNKSQHLDYCGFDFTLDTRCKWDWFINAGNFGGDLKTTSATSLKQFEEAIEVFDWDRSRAWYMDIANSNEDFIYAISKVNFQVFSLHINRNDKTYERGKDKYSELAFLYWTLG